VIAKMIKKISKQLDKDKIGYMIIGGQAVLLYGTPRLTRDIDITLGVDTDRFSLIEGICKKLRLKILPEDPEDFARDTKVLPAEDVKLKIRVDFIFSFSPYESQAIKRTKEGVMDGYPVRFASCEDVIIHKMLASRAIDAEDVKNILIKNKDSLDVGYISEWLSQFGKISEYEGIVEKFNGLLEL